MPFNFNLQPTLEGKLLKLRPLKSEDFEELFIAASDPLIWELHPESDRYKREVFEKYFEGAIQSGGAFAVIDKATGKMIGSSRYYGYKPEERQILVGYTFLARSHWGGNYNQEMKSLMLNHAFQFVETVLFEIGEKNYRSRRAIEKIGAQFVGPKAEIKSSPHVIYKIEKVDTNS